MFKYKKIYGCYKVDNCPFCDKQGITKNPQDITVCLAHKDKLLDEQKCACGEFLELKSGKFGPYFYCFKCGNQNFRKILDK